MDLKTDKTTMIARLSDLIAETIFSECDSIFQIDRAAETYQALKISPVMKRLLKEEGTYNSFCMVLFFRASLENDSHTYDYFIRKGMESPKAFFRRIRINDGDNDYDLDYLYLPGKTDDTAYAVLLPVQDDMNRRVPEGIKAHALEDGFLYSMVVNLDSNECSQAHVSEIDHEEHTPVNLRYSEWRNHILTSILPEFQPLFLEKTDAEAVRHALRSSRRYFFDVKMYNLKGQSIWTRHAVIKIQNESNEELVFVYTVQDIDTIKKEQIWQTHLQKQSSNPPLSSGSQKESFQGSSLSLAILNQIEKEIREQYMKPLTLSQMAKKYYINSAYLGQLFIRRYKMSFHQYLTKQRMETAARLLTDSGKTVQEIARETGISNTNYFNRLFQNHFHCTPLEYRDTH